MGKISRQLIISWFILTVGLALMTVNIYGLTQSIRKSGLGETDQEQLRFLPEKVWTYSQSLNAIDDLGSVQTRRALAERANQIIHNSLIHVEWERVDPEEYRQLVPFWENYFLWAVGRFTNLPQFERYHYSDYRRSIRRGIGICGDASTALSSVLDRYKVPNRIVSFDGHVIVEYEMENGDQYLIDPDFGVSLGTSLESLKADADKVRTKYLLAGYSEREVSYLFQAYERRYSIFDDTYHFMTKRYLFEKTSYVLKWLLPAGLILISSIWILIAHRSRRF